MTAMIPAWEDGVLTPVEKLEVHKRGLRHKAISVFVFAGERLLIQRRAMEKYHTPGQWANTCCTHPHWDEEAEACALRRLDEELGLTGVQLEHRDQVEYRAEVGRDLIEHELVDIYVSHNAAQMAFTPNPDEVMDTAWVTLEELRTQIDERPDRFTPWLKIYLAEHSEQILGATVSA